MFLTHKSSKMLTNTFLFIIPASDIKMTHEEATMLAEHIILVTWESENRFNNVSDNDMDTHENNMHQLVTLYFLMEGENASPLCISKISYRWSISSCPELLQRLYVLPSLKFINHWGLIINAASTLNGFKHLKANCHTKNLKKM